MTANYEAAAIKAAELLIKHNVSVAPVDPLPMLKNIPGVVLVSYEKVSDNMGIDRRCLISMFGNQDAFTSVNLIDGQKQFIVTYNRLLSYSLVKRALARELGHIVLGHDGSRPEEVRNEEAVCFSHHLLCPRPLIYAIQATGLRFTKEVFGNLTDCNEVCIPCLRKMPEVHVPAEMNRQIKAQFMKYIINFFEYERNASIHDGTAIADLGSYMNGYEE